LESIKELYATDFDFKDAYENCRDGRTRNKYVLCDNLLYRDNKLCVPASSVRLLFLQEALCSAHFFWLKVRRDVERYVSQCTTCNKAKSQPNPHSLYMSLLVPSVPWEDISMDFVL
jgi:hypothetical protein